MADALTASFTKKFPGGPAIHVEDLRTMERGGVTVLFGASGSGKTTALRCLAGLERPEAGVIQFGSDVWLDSAQRKFIPPQHRQIGFVPQDYALFPHLTVKKNVAYGLNHLSAADQRNRVTETLDWLGLNELGDRLPRELSGGQQQRVALARAVVRRPRLLLLDEPLSALDAPTRSRLRGELRRLLADLGIPTLLVTHDRLEAMALGDELVVMDNGKIAQRGPVHEVFTRPATLAAAEILAIETVHPGAVLETREGLAIVQAGVARLTALAEDLPLDARQVYVCIHAEDVILMQNKPGQSSARNQLPAVVTAITREGHMMRIEVDCGFPLKALLTRQACEEFSLKPGDTVFALIKAPHIHLIPRPNKIRS